MQLVSRFHGIADKVEGEHINMVAADLIFESLNGNHSVEPLNIVFGHFGNGVVPSLCLKILNMIAVVIAFLN